MKSHLHKFVKESNAIEGITRGPTKAEIKAHERFFNMPAITVAALEQLVAVLQPDAELRSRPGLNVIVGSHMPPPGGSAIKPALEKLLRRAYISKNPWDIHCRYEDLHPFTDGNGRSGRALWAWSMLQGRDVAPLRYGFLQMFYYQTLENYEGAELPTPERYNHNG